MLFSKNKEEKPGINPNFRECTSKKGTGLPERTIESEKHGNPSPFIFNN